MTFDEWHAEQQKPYKSEDCAHIDWERVAWKAAIDAAVEAGNKLVIERCGLNEEQESVYTVAIDEYQEAIQRLKGEK